MTLADLIPTLRPVLAARLEPGLWPLTTGATCDGRVTVGGSDLSELAGRHGTPLRTWPASRGKCSVSSGPAVVEGPFR